MKPPVLILTRHGLSGLTIKNLAAEMQFSESALYRHFKSKEDIIIALLNYLAVNMDKRLSLAYESNDNPATKFNKLFESQFKYFNQHPHFVVAVFSDCLLEESAYINEMTIKLMGIKKAHALPIIIEGQQKGVFINDISAEAMMHIIIGAFRLKMFKWRASNFNFNIEVQGKSLSSHY